MEEPPSQRGTGKSLPPSMQPEAPPLAAPGAKEVAAEHATSPGGGTGRRHADELTEPRARRGSLHRLPLFSLRGGTIYFLCVVSMEAFVRNSGTPAARRGHLLWRGSPPMSTLQESRRQRAWERGVSRQRGADVADEHTGGRPPSSMYGNILAASMMLISTDLDLIRFVI